MDYYKTQASDNPLSLPNTVSVSERILTLPLYPNMTNEELNYMIETVDEFFEIRKTS